MLFKFVFVVFCAAVTYHVYKYILLMQYEKYDVIYTHHPGPCKQLLGADGGGSEDITTLSDGLTFISSGCFPSARGRILTFNFSDPNEMLTELVIEPTIPKFHPVGISVWEEPSSTVPDIDRLYTLFEACRTMQDTVGRQLIMYEKQIREHEITFKYHKSCRASYASPKHIQRFLKQSFLGTSAEHTDEQISRRSRQLSFDWKNMCFICGKLCSRSRKQEWSMVESSIDLSSNSIFGKVYRAANERKDEAMLLRLSEVANGDSVAIEARYHRKKSCIASYLNPKSIEAAIKIFSETQTRYDEVLRELMTKTPYSDLVCSAEITVCDALRKAKQLLNVIQQSDEAQIGTLSSSGIRQTSDDSIIHLAVGILRSRMMKASYYKEEYYSFDEMSLSAMNDFVDPLLYKALCW
ncbi:unnamed protein product [Mytilus coruscus]|uniref:Uncharacterized protein n=1 Tax=Mytilus coruscus TaxID=42192 RepID=A0A6J8CGX3_MYTCO|nr:unnamed protein product [Mytilus coruscus]